MKKIMTIITTLIVFVGFTYLVIGDYIELKASTNNETNIKGSLLIAGGGLSSSNAQVYNAFLESGQSMRGRGVEDLKIGIMPTAGSNPIQSANSAKNRFVNYGAAPENIDIIPIAVRDDSSTEFDESTWKDNGYSEEIAEQVLQYDAIWFVGGAQIRIVEALLTDDGSDTPVLSALRSIYQDGAVIAGSSAGAAMMGGSMIYGGTSYGALELGAVYTTDSVDDDRVIWTDGLGFFKGGTIDQHLNQRGRFARMIVGAWESGMSLSYGIDENTAMLVNNQTHEIEVLGEHGITIVDLDNARKNTEYPIEAKGINISYIENGDVFNWETKEFTLVDRDRDTIANPQYSPNPAKLDIFAPGHLIEILFDDLVNNEANAHTSLALEPMYLDDRGNNGVVKIDGFRLTFSKTDQTEGYLGTIDGNETQAALNVNLDISPIDMKIQYNENINDNKLEPFQPKVY